MFWNDDCGTLHNPKKVNCPKCGLNIAAPHKSDIVLKF